MSRKTKVKTATGHTLFVERVEKTDDHPASDVYETYWIARFYCAGKPDEKVRFYLAKGFPGGEKQIMVWYGDKTIWASYGNTLKEAINGAIADAWLKL